MQKSGLAILTILFTLLEVGFPRSTPAAQNLNQMTGTSMGSGTTILVAKACTQRRYRRPH